MLKKKKKKKKGMTLLQFIFLKNRLDRKLEVKKLFKIHNFFFFFFFFNQTMFCCCWSRRLAPISALAFSWHFQPPGLARISKGKYPAPSKGKGMLCRAHSDLPDQVRGALQRSAGRFSSRGQGCNAGSRGAYRGNPAQRLREPQKTRTAFSPCSFPVR